MIANEANHFVFSTRLISAKFRNVAAAVGMPYTIFKHPEVAKENLRTMLGGVITIAAAAAVAKMFGSDVETNPLSPTFLRLRDGNTSYDLTGGYGSIVRFIAQMAMGKTKDPTTGKIKEADKGNLVLRFIKSKQSPLLNLLGTLITGKTYFGKEINWAKDWPEQAREHFVFMWLNDGIDAFSDMYDKAGLGEVIAKSGINAGLSWAGVGVQTYTKSNVDKVFAKYESASPEERKTILPQLTAHVRGMKLGKMADVKEWKAGYAQKQRTGKKEWTGHTQADIDALRAYLLKSDLPEIRKLANQIGAGAGTRTVPARGAKYE